MTYDIQKSTTVRLLSVLCVLALSAPADAGAVADPDQFGKGGCLMRFLNSLRSQGWRFDTLDRDYHMDIQEGYFVNFTAFPVEVKRTPITAAIGQPSQLQFDILWHTQELTNCFPSGFWRYTLDIRSSYRASETETSKLRNLEEIAAAAKDRRPVLVIGILKFTDPEVSAREFLLRQKPPVFQREELTRYRLEIIQVNGREFESLRDR